MLRRVVGASMLPTLAPGRLILARRYGANSDSTSSARVGDVVIITHNGVEKIKRIQATKDGKVYVVGDNMEQSTDSRDFGWIEQTMIQGKVLWPRT